MEETHRSQEAVTGRWRSRKDDSRSASVNVARSHVDRARKPGSYGRLHYGGGRWEAQPAECWEGTCMKYYRTIWAEEKPPLARRRAHSILTSSYVI